MKWFLPFRWFLVLTLVLGSVRTARPQAVEPAPVPDLNTNAPAVRRTSIVFILADDLGWGDLGCYGQKRIKTPNLDKLAAEGMRFTDFYAGSTVCAPSRATLMLGKHTGHIALRGNKGGGTLLTDEYTFAQQLQASGYRTGLIGKWGLSDVGLPGVPRLKGFDEFVGYLNNQHAHDYYPSSLWRYDVNSGYEGTVQLAKNANDAKREYAPDLCTRAAENFIRINKPAPYNQRRPFFLALNYTIPHANNELGRRTGNGMEVPDAGLYASEPWPEPERNKAAMITRLDDCVGRIVAALRKAKMDDTVLFFTSDNGPHKEGGADPKFHNSSGPWRGHKRDLTEGGIRVPMIVWWPGKVPAGVVNTQVWTMWDVFPTLAGIARLVPPDGLDGISMLPTLLGRPQTNQHDHLYWEFHERGFHQAVRLGEWKGIRHGTNSPVELYSLKTDPGETNNVAAANAAIVATIEELMRTSRVDHPDWPALPAQQAGTNAAAAADAESKDR